MRSRWINKKTSDFLPVSHQQSGDKCLQWRTSPTLWVRSTACSLTAPPSNPKMVTSKSKNPRWRCQKCPTGVHKPIGDIHYIMQCLHLSHCQHKEVLINAAHEDSNFPACLPAALRVWSSIKQRSITGHMSFVDVSPHDKNNHMFNEPRSIRDWNSQSVRHSNHRGPINIIY